MGYIFIIVFSAYLTQVLCGQFVINNFEKVNLAQQNDSYNCSENECINGQITFIGEKKIGVQVNFRAFGRTFNIISARGFSRLPGSRDITDIETLNTNGTLKSHFPKTDFLLGRLRGRPECKVEGYLENEFPKLTIYCPEDIYNIEPSASFTKDGKIYNAIITRTSDIYYSPCEGTNCSGVLTRTLDLNEHPSSPYASEQIESEITKYHLGRSCDLHIIADHTFKKFHENQENGIFSDVSNTVRLVDFWFRNVDFNGDDVSDSFGISLAKLSVLDERYFDYLLKSDNLTAEEILDKLGEMAVVPRIGEHCLVVLFTHRDLKSSYFQGLSMQSGSNPTSIGGVCAKVTKIEGKGKRRPNVAFVTNINRDKMLPRLVLAVNLAHVIGHSLGAIHDDDTEFYGQNAVCSSINRKRWYIMSSVAFKPMSKNNYEFSKCSLRMMLPVMRNKGSCFKRVRTPTEALCGDGEIQPGEECDCGYEDQCSVIDPCCTPALHVVGKPCTISRELGSECSPRMSQCCDETCKIQKSTDMKCNVYHSECRHESYCNGSSSECPVTFPLADFTSCARRTRMCYRGKCDLSPCLSHDKEINECPCAGSDECKVCCRVQGMCKPGRKLGIYAARGKEFIRQEGTPCAYGKGTCDSLGVCRLQPLDLAMDAVHTPVEKIRTSDKVGYVILAALIIILIVVAIVVVAGVMCYGHYTLQRRSEQLSHFYNVVDERELELRHVSPEQIRQQSSRLMALFPGAPVSEVLAVATEQETEGAMVTVLLGRGYPIRKDFVTKMSTEIPPQIFKSTKDQPLTEYRFI